MNKPAPAALASLIGLAVVVFGIGVAAVARGTATPGHPVAISSAPSTGVAHTSSAPALPPRTRDVDVRDAKPCQALTPQQIRQLDYDLGYRTPPMPGTDMIHHGPSCDFSSERRNIGVTVIYSTTAGANAWLTDPALTGVNHTAMITVDGFPAVRVVNTYDAQLCLVVVDNHDKQYVGVFSTSDGAPTSTGTSAYCREATNVAEMVMHTLTER